MGNQQRNDKNSDFIKRVESLTGDEYTFLDTYVNIKTKLKCIHNKCGHIWEVSPNNFLLNGTRCNRCSGLLRLTDDDFKKQVHDIVGDEYFFSDQYKNTKTPIKCVHTICGHEWKIAPQNFLKFGNRCPNCAGQVITSESFKSRVYEIVNDEYDFVDEYVNMKTDLKCIHKTCYTESSISPSNFLYNNMRCHNCTHRNKSYKEEFISSVLDMLNIEYIREKRFDDCRHEKTLPFDFYTKIDSKEFCIEYDGIQHFRAIEAWGGEERLSKQKLIDNIKTNFCNENDILLLRLNYLQTDQEIKDEINNFIKRSTTIPDTGVGSSDPKQEQSSEED